MICVVIQGAGDRHLQDGDGDGDGDGDDDGDGDGDGQKFLVYNSKSSTCHGKE